MGGCRLSENEAQRFGSMASAAEISVFWSVGKQAHGLTQSIRIVPLGSHQVEQVTRFDDARPAHPMYEFGRQNVRGRLGLDGCVGHNAAGGRPDQCSAAEGRVVTSMPAIWQKLAI